MQIQLFLKTYIINPYLLLAFPFQSKQNLTNQNKELSTKPNNWRQEIKERAFKMDLLYINSINFTVLYISVPANYPGFHHVHILIIVLLFVL